MGWEEDALEAYRNGQVRKVQNNERHSRQNQLLEAGHMRTWTALRSLFADECQRICEMANSAVLVLTDPRADKLRIERADGEVLVAVYSLEGKGVTFSSGVLPFVEQKYTLDVREIDGVESLIWTHEEGFVKPELIVENVISSFLRAGL